MTAEHFEAADEKPSAPGVGGPRPLTLYMVKRLELIIRSLLDDELRPRGLTNLQYTVLNMLQRPGGMSSSQLARRCFMRAQTMHELVLTMEKRGLVTRTTNPANRRARIVTLTSGGRDLLAVCAPGVQRLEDQLLDGLSAGQRETFREGLEHGISVLGTESVARRSTVVDKT